MRAFTVTTCGSKVYCSAFNTRKSLSSGVPAFARAREDLQEERDYKRSALYRSVKMVERLFYSNNFQFFTTLTIAPSLGIDRSDYGACKQAVTSALNRFVKEYPGSTYLLVPDFHEDGSFHFHGFFNLSVGTNEALKKAGHFRIVKYGARRTKYYSPLLNKLLGRNEFRPLIHMFEERSLQYALKYVVKAASLVQCEGHSLYIRSRGLQECTCKRVYLGEDACALEAVFSSLKRDKRHSYDYDVYTWSPMDVPEFDDCFRVYLRQLFYHPSVISRRYVPECCRPEQLAIDISADDGGSL